MIYKKHKFSERQAHIVWLVSEGHSDYEICSYLKVDELTLKKDWKEMHEMLGEENKVELVKKVFPWKELNMCEIKG